MGMRPTADAATAAALGAVGVAGRVTRLAAACLAIASLVAACAAPGTPVARSGPLIEVDGLVFENRSRVPIQAIRLLVPVTGEFVQCGNIPPDGRCATGFPERVYSGSAVQVSATQRGTEWTTGEVEAVVAPELANGGLAQVWVIVIAPGSAGVQL
ncbi:MAG: hypothetical protein P8008_06660, partial [Gammaproteobacteria bacterium]